MSLRILSDWASRVDAKELKEMALRYESVRKKVILASAQSPGLKEPQLIAVSKFQSFKKIEELSACGQNDFGENYVQELVEKANQAKVLGLTKIAFHFIGHLQTNKVKVLLPHVDSIHSVDSIRLLQEINRQAGKLTLKMKCYFQVNLDQEPTKSGFSESELAGLCNAVMEVPWIEPQGLMAIPDPKRTPEESFKRLAQLSAQYGARLGMGLSMGMSEDFECAIRHGSTVVRVGSALFGPREK